MRRLRILGPAIVALVALVASCAADQDDLDVRATLSVGERQLITTDDLREAGLPYTASVSRLPVQGSSAEYTPAQCRELLDSPAGTVVTVKLFPVRGADEPTPDPGAGPAVSLLITPASGLTSASPDGCEDVVVISGDAETRVRITAAESVRLEACESAATFVVRSGDIERHVATCVTPEKIGAFLSVNTGDRARAENLPALLELQAEKLAHPRAVLSRVSRPSLESSSPPTR